MYEFYQGRKLQQLDTSQREYDYVAARIGPSFDSEIVTYLARHRNCV